MSFDTTLMQKLTNVSPLLTALKDRAQIHDGPAVYAMASSVTFGRLRGESRVLYVGSTGRLGGATDRARLYSHLYPNPNSPGKRAKDIYAALEANGHQLSFHWCEVETKQAALQLESSLLLRSCEEHHELPPLNSKRGG